jgi:predicted aspartyl protease
MGYFSPLFKVLGAASLISGLTGCSALVSAMKTVEPDTPPVATSQPAPANPQSAPAEVPSAQTTPSPTNTTSPQEPKPQRNYFREGVNRASGAVAIGQSAQSQDDWTLAANRWQQAVDLLLQVPANSPDYAQAQSKIQEYRTYLNSAQQQAQGQSVQITQNPPTRPDGLIAQIPIQERRGGTPVIAVSLKGQHSRKTFPMLFDTGATGTLITKEMADAIGVAIVGQTRAKIADGSVVTLPVGYITAIEVGGLRKEGIPVAIGGSVGLLGQDFYGEYGIAMGSHVINLHK